MKTTERTNDDPAYWLMKTEPDVYGWPDLVREGEGVWDGVRNHQAANNLRAMKVGDAVFIYHSNRGREIVGIAEVTKAGLSDPSDPTGRWAAVKVRACRTLAAPVSLARIKGDPALRNMDIVRLPRLSVARVSAEQWEKVIALAEHP